MAHGENGERAFSQLVDAYFTKVVVNVIPRTVAQYRAWLNYCCEAAVKRF